MSKHLTANDRQNWRVMVSAVAASHDLSLEDLLADKRSCKFIKPRFIAYKLLHDEGLGYIAIGHVMKRDHKTVMNGVAKAIEKGWTA